MHGNEHEVLMKKSLLVAEGGDHYKILEQLYHLLKDDYELEFFIIDNTRYDYTELFPSINKTNTSKTGFRGVLYFLRLLLKGWRYDIINISTGPDGGHFTEYFRVLTFFLCCFCFRSKIVLTLRNPYNYLESSPGLLNYLRAKSVSYLKYFTFETKTMRKTFIEVTGRSDIKCAITYDRYPDVSVGYDKRVTKQREPSDKIRVGLLGGVNPLRRDYESVMAALREMSLETRAKYEIWTLGGCAGGVEHPVISEMSKLVSVNVVAGMLSEELLAQRAMQCDVFLAPLSDDKEYGTLHGSGSFGDCVYFQKTIIIPRRVDPNDEFEAVAFYYSTAKELQQVLEETDFSLSHTSENFYEQFSTTHVLGAIHDDLGCSGIKKAN